MNFMIDHRSYTHDLKADLCDTGGVLYQLSYQALWNLVTL